jgi:hypothetical protein
MERIANSDLLAILDAVHVGGALLALGTLGIRLHPMLFAKHNIGRLQVKGARYG